MIETISIPSPPAAQAAIPMPVLENLAVRFRPGGLCLILLRPDGSLLFHDNSANLFFQRFALPMIQYPDALTGWGEQIASLKPTSAIEVWNNLPGVVVAVFPYVERRQLMGIMLLAARSASFRLNEDVVHVCGHLGLDALWLNQQADELPVYPEETIHRQARLLLGMIRDQLRLASLEQELDSLSGQLANTYEELSLIYQISSGMRINRTAKDFFKQACLEVMGVMNVRGMGVAPAPMSSSRSQCCTAP